MKAKTINNNLMVLLRELAVAAAVYERSLFYYDRMKDSKNEVDVSLSYTRSTKNLASISEEYDNGGVSDRAMLGYMHVLGFDLLEFYYNAGIILSQRYQEVGKLYDSCLLTIRKNGIYEVEREPENTKWITDNSIKGYFDTISVIRSRYSEDVRKGYWFTYTVELGFLCDWFYLLADEVGYLGGRIDDFEHHINEKSFRRLNFVMVGLGVAAIMVTIVVS